MAQPELTGGGQGTPATTGGSSPGATGGGTSPLGSIVSGGSLAPVQIWDALEQAGLSAVQAAGVMGNMIAESSLNPEAHVLDSNGYESYGLLQWNAATYPGAASLVTGNISKDLSAQVSYALQTIPQSALTGSTPQQVAANVASGFERCSTCQSGGSQNNTRQQLAAQVAGWAQSGNWPATTGGAFDTATLGAAASAQSTSTCVLGWSGIFGVGSFCALSKSQARALLAGGILLGGGLLALFGVMSLLGTTGTGQQILSKLPAAVPVPV